MTPKSDTPKSATRPQACPLCGQPPESTKHTAREPRVMDVWELTCPEHGDLAVTIPLDDVDKAAQRFTQNVDERRRQRRGGNR